MPLRIRKKRSDEAEQNTEENMEEGSETLAQMVENMEEEGVMTPLTPTARRGHPVNPRPQAELPSGIADEEESIYDDEEEEQQPPTPPPKKKRPRTQKQIEAFEKAKQKRQENIKKTKQLKEEQKKKNKKVKKRKEIIQHLDDSSDSEDELTSIIERKVRKITERYKKERANNKPDLEPETPPQKQVRIQNPDIRQHPLEHSRNTTTDNWLDVFFD